MILVLFALLGACSSPAATEEGAGPVAPVPTAAPEDTVGEEHPAPSTPAETPAETLPLAPGEVLAPFGAPATWRWEDAEGGPITLAWVVRPHGSLRKVFLVGFRGSERIELGEGPELNPGQPCQTTSATFVRNGANVVAVVGRDEAASAADAAECPRWRTNSLLVLRAGAPVVAQRFDGFPDDAGHGPAWLYATRPAATAPRLVAHLVFESLPQQNEENDTPRTKVSVTTESLPDGATATTEIGTYQGSCSYADPPEVRGALLHLRCWWAGAGDEVVLVRQGNRLVVRHAETDEQAPRSRWREVHRIDLPRGAELETFQVR